jgi:hypothetical protein
MERKTGLVAGHREDAMERKTQQDWLQFIDSARSSLDLAEMVIRKAVRCGDATLAADALNRSHDFVTDAMTHCVTG